MDKLDAMANSRGGGFGDWRLEQRAESFGLQYWLLVGLCIDELMMKRLICKLHVEAETENNSNRFNIKCTLLPLANVGTEYLVIS